MAGETIITLVGNLTADPELRWTNSGAAVASFTVASTPRTFNRQANEWQDGETLFVRCSAWRDMAENVADSLQKGMRVVVQGRLQQRSYETRDGEKRTSIEMQVDEVGPSLRYATANVTRNPRGGGFSGGQGGGSGSVGGQVGFGSGQTQATSAGFGAGSAGGSDPWANQGGTSEFDEDPPF